MTKKQLGAVAMGDYKIEQKAKKLAYFAAGFITALVLVGVTILVTFAVVVIATK